MYDPARDSWKAEDDQPADSKQQTTEPKIEETKPVDVDSSTENDGIPLKKESIDQENSSTGTSSNKPRNKDTLDEKTIEKTAETLQSPELPETNTKETTRQDTPEGKVSDPKSDHESADYVSRTEVFKKHKRDREDETIPEEQSNKHGIDEERPESKEPPKKLKRPTVRSSQKEREEAARAIRERMERQEKMTRQRDDQVKERAVVRDHYNRLPDQGQQRRQQSPIIKLRSFNNWVKSMLIHTYGRQGDTVLDIGCGKGGDLLKWNRARIAGFIGVDIAEISIEQAQGRYNSSRLGFWAKFVVGDPFEQPIEDVLKSQAFAVDVVSCQFCLHYSFESENRARTLLANISKMLRPGSYFIGTIPNSDVIIKHIRKLKPGSKSWGNSIYSVEFETDPPRDGHFNPPFGHKYTFFLEDAVGNVPEYVVPFEAFRALCEEYNLVLEHKKPFLKFFDEQVTDNFAMNYARRMGVVRSDGVAGIEGDEREACGFYTVFAFKKVR